MKPVKDTYIERAVSAAAVRVRHYAAVGQMLSYVASEVLDTTHGARREEIERAWLIMAGALERSQAQAAKDLLMFSACGSQVPLNVGLDLLAERFCEKHIPYKIMDLLNTRDVSVGSYYDADEKAFRKEVKEVLARRKKAKR